MRKMLAIGATKFLIWLGQAMNKQGSSTPGKIGLKIYPNLLKDLAAQVREDIFVVCGTNGKTTTNNLLCEALRSEGKKVVCNSAGANMLYGIVTAFADSVDSADSVSPAKLHVAREAGSDTVDMLAAEHLSTMKLQFAANPSALGFGADELSCALLGNAFTLYVFDTSGRIVSDDTLAYPVIYNDEIIAVLEVYYDNTNIA